MSRDVRDGTHPPNFRPVANGTLSPNDDPTAPEPTLTTPIRALDIDPMSVIDPVLLSESPAPPHHHNSPIQRTVDNNRHATSQYGGGDGNGNGNDDSDGDGGNGADEDIFRHDTHEIPRLPALTDHLADSEPDGGFSSYSPPPSPTTQGPLRGRKYRHGQNVLSQVRRKYYDNGYHTRSR